MRRRFFLLLFGIVLLIFIFGSTAVGLYTDWLWFKQLGFREVFSTILVTKLVLGLGVTGLTFGVVFGSLALAVWFTREKGIFITTGENEFTEIEMSPQRLRRICLLFSLVIAGFAGLVAAGHWQTVLQFIHRTSVQQSDPIFHRDISFYLFELPLWQYLLNLGFALTIIGLIGTTIIYGLKSSVGFSRRGLTISSSAKVHLSILAAGFFLCLAFSAYLDMPNLMYSPRGVVTGPSYADIHAQLPLLKALFWVSLFGVLLLIGNCFTVTNRPVVAAVGLYLLVLVAQWVYPASIQNFVVAPNEIDRETPFILNNIAATRKAYGIDRVEERTLSGQNTLTLQDIQANDATIKNVRLWDREPLLATFSQIQEIRTYYKFNSVDNDRYLIDGQYRQTLLSPRELASDLLPSRTWINERLVFTHGYGLTLGPVNRVTPEGLPVLFIKDLPPTSSIDRKVQRPEIYYGEVVNGYVFVRTREKEFDYPAGDNNVFTEYQGDGGVPIRSWFRKAMFAFRFGALKILLSDDIAPTSRVLFYRNIKQRVRRVAPFLRYDNDPYMVISDDGHLYWIYDGYTVSDRYPYAQPIRGLGNYIRNAVKVVIDAFDGHMWFYIADRSDPLIQTLAKIFPRMFLPLDQMPADLRAHLRYPTDLFSIQTHIYSIYHMQNPQVFYNKEDQWEIPVYSAGNKEQPMQPYYIIMKLPGETQEEFILMLPFTPKQKDNLAAWMVARSDGTHYGQLISYVFPKQTLIYGPRQISARINQHPEISRQISLWDQRGSQVLQGTLLVIPIEESLIYVQPLYLRAETGKIPELKRVIAAYQNQIAMGGSLEEALAKIFAGARLPQPQVASVKPQGSAPPVPASLERLAAQAQQHYDRAQDALRAGDWARYGDEMKRLGQVIKKLNQP